MPVVIAVIVGGLIGAAWGNAFGMALGAVVGWLVVRSKQQERADREPAGGVEGVAGAARRRCRAGAARRTGRDACAGRDHRRGAPEPAPCSRRRDARARCRADAAASPLLAPPPPRAPRPPPPPKADPLAPVKAWLFGGNTIVKAGVGILFIGLAFLAKFASEHVQVPVELRLAGIGAVALVLLVVGWRLRLRARRAMRRCCRAARWRCST